MAKFNPTTKGTAIMDKINRLAGGAGAPAAVQNAEALLRRAVMTCLLWEDLAYETGGETVTNIKQLVPQVAAEQVYEIALAARLQQKLRHVPLLLALEMLKYDAHRLYVAALLPKIITRADQLTDILALYFKEGKRPIAKALQKGLAASFATFDEYQFAKYDRDNAVKLRDVLFLTHPKPAAYNYIVDVSAHKRGINYKGVWSAEISGWSEQFLNFIAAFEGLTLQEAISE
jgi:60 kDa SS-A/Ro ribonucleoprotein